jgi:hypothetical protein
MSLATSCVKVRDLETSPYILIQTNDDDHPHHFPPSPTIDESMPQHNRPTFLYNPLNIPKELILYTIYHASAAY